MREPRNHLFVFVLLSKKLKRSKMFPFLIKNQQNVF